jgi:dTDP-4-amino-4,6-dideoxygalactose transaminase
MFRLPFQAQGKSVTATFDCFARRGIAARHRVGQVVHREEGYPDGQFPRAIQALQSTVLLPFYPALSEAEVNTVVAAIRASRMAARAAALALKLTMAWLFAWEEKFKAAE